jgi:hypothetical protein
MTSREFINSLNNKIDKIPNFPVLESLAIAQACLESRFGRKSFHNNIYGIKCHDINAYAGCRLGRTSEVIDGEYQHNLKLAFQTYDSIDDSIEDYARLMNLKRYKRVRDAKDYIEATQAIKDCGYATSTSYINSLRKLIERYKLYELDFTGQPWDFVTQNFRLKEFVCKDNTAVPEHLIDNVRAVAKQLQIVRNHYNKPIRINSAYRTPKYNRSVGGALKSMHLLALAVDTKPLFDISIDEYYKTMLELTIFKGYGIGNTFLHTDLRDTYTIWYY